MAHTGKSLVRERLACRGRADSYQLNARFIVKFTLIFRSVSDITLYALDYQNGLLEGALRLSYVLLLTKRVLQSLQYKA